MNRSAKVCIVCGREIQWRKKCQITGIRLDIVRAPAAKQVSPKLI